MQGDALSDALGLPPSSARDKVAESSAVLRATRLLLALSSSWLFGWWVRDRSSRGFRLVLLTLLGGGPPTFEMAPCHDPGRRDEGEDGKGEGQGPAGLQELLEDSDSGGPSELMRRGEHSPTSPP